MNDYSVVDTHINLIGPGDTVVHDGKMMTVTLSNLKRDGFMGRTLFGDCYVMGYKPVKKVVFKKLELYNN